MSAIFKFRLVKFKIAFLALSVFLLSGCKIETPPVTLTVSPGPITVTPTNFTCAVSTSASAITSGQSFPVTIQVAGGVGPYSLDGISGSFITTYTFPRTLSITGTNSQVTNSSFTVTDSAGRSTTCQLSVTVSPVTATNPLSCSAVASDDTPAIDQSITFTTTAAGGSGTYFFTGFIPGGNGVITASLNQASPTTAAAGAKYPSAGLNTAVFYIADSNGNSATCAKTISVESGASVSLTASPSSTIPANQTMTITANPSGFTGTPTYTFSISGTGLNLTASGATATVTAVDSSTTRTGTVTVTAVSGSQSATSSLPVTFTAQSSTLNCSISYTGGTYQPGQSVPFSITANTGEALNVTYILVEDGYVVGGVATQSPSIVFYYSGYKNVRALAQSASTGVACNSGNYLQTNIYISPTSSQFTCTLTMTPNPTNTYTWILASAQATGAQGLYWIESLTADRLNTMIEDQLYSTGQSLSSSTPAYRYVYFTYPGTYSVTARLRDSSGRTATCSTTEIINSTASSTPVTNTRFCGIYPAQTDQQFCTMEYYTSYYYSGSQCYPLISGGCNEKGAFRSLSECLETVSAGLCGSW